MDLNGQDIVAGDQAGGGDVRDKKVGRLPGAGRETCAGDGTARHVDPSGFHAVEPNDGAVIQDVRRGQRDAGGVGGEIEVRAEVIGDNARRVGAGEGEQSVLGGRGGGRLVVE